MEWIYPLGVVGTFPIAYWQARKHMTWLKGDSLENLMYELLVILVTIPGAVLWPLTWTAYAVMKLSQKVTPKQTLPEGYTYHVTEKGSEFEKVVIRNPEGRKIADAYTGVYGLDGAAREATKDALKVLEIENRSATEYDDVLKKYNR